MKTIPCSVGILTRNSEGSLERTLRSCARFAEIIIADGGSVDQTVEIATRHGCRIIAQDADLKRSDGSLRDFAGAVNQLLSTATQPWFIKVDSDEVVSEELSNELAHRLSAVPTGVAYRIPFLYVVSGDVIREATTYPMRQVRVLPTGSGVAFVGPIHESPETGQLDLVDLSSPMLLPQQTVRQLVPKWVRYARVELKPALGVGPRAWWRTWGRRTARSLRYLAWRYTKVLRSSVRPRLPLRYELLRMANDAVRLVAGAVLSLVPVPKPEARNGDVGGSSQIPHSVTERANDSADMTAAAPSQE